MIINHTSETESVTPGSGQHIEELVTTFVESLASFVNPFFTDPFVLPLIYTPSTRYVDYYYSCLLPPSSSTTQSFGMNPSSFGFPERLGNSYFPTNHVVVTVGASTLPETSVNQVTLTQPRAHTSPFAHE
jgi:hypothetical protein